LRANASGRKKRSRYIPAHERVARELATWIRIVDEAQLPKQ
jgi:anti-sigma factor RsiW